MYKDPNSAALMQNAMTMDFSWEDSAREYLQLYEMARSAQRLSEKGF